MAEKSKQLAASSAPVGAAQDARPVTPGSLNTTSDLQGIFKRTMCGLLNDEMPVKKVNAVVAVGGKMLKTVEVEYKVAERAGHDRRALALSGE